MSKHLKTNFLLCQILCFGPEFSLSYSLCNLTLLVPHLKNFSKINEFSFRSFYNMNIITEQMKRLETTLDEIWKSNESRAVTTVKPFPSGLPSILADTLCHIHSVKWDKDEKGRCRVLLRKPPA